MIGDEVNDGRVSLRALLRSPDHRALYLTFFLSGCSASAAWPLLPLFLTTDLGAPPSAVGLFYLTQLITPVVTVAIGWYSDRRPARLPMIRGMIGWLAVGWAAMAAARGLALMVVLALVFLSVGGALSAQLFAAVDDLSTRRRERRRVAVASTLRGGYALGYVAGPLLGEFLASAVNVRAALLAAAALCLACLIPLSGRRTDREVDSGQRADGGTDAVGRLSRRVLVALVIGIALVLSGDALKFAYLPIYVVDRLHRSPVVYGSLLTTSAVAEIIAFPLVGLLADRIGAQAIIAAALAVGVADYAWLGSGWGFWRLYVIQILHVAVIVGVFGVGISYLQAVNRSAAGVTSSVVLAAQGVAESAGGALGSLGAVWFGIPHLFWIPSGSCLLCLVSYLIWIRRRTAGGPS